MSITIEKYSEKSYVVRGNIEQYKKQLEDLGGLYNNSLKGSPGFIFYIQKKALIENLKKGIEDGNITKHTDIISHFNLKRDQNNDKKEQNNDQNNDKKYFSFTEYSNLLARVERLEAIILNNKDLLKNIKNDINTHNLNNEEKKEEKNEKIVKKKKKDIVIEPSNEDDDTELGNDGKVKRLLKIKL